MTYRLISNGFSCDQHLRAHEDIAIWRGKLKGMNEGRFVLKIGCNWRPSHQFRCSIKKGSGVSAGTFDFYRKSFVISLRTKKTIFPQNGYYPNNYTTTKNIISIRKNASMPVRFCKEICTLHTVTNYAFVVLMLSAIFHIPVPCFKLSQSRHEGKCRNSSKIFPEKSRG